jgi:two-component system, NtrC family, nitrogen regulation sensor histidine kinase NtrY
MNQRCRSPRGIGVIADFLTRAVMTDASIPAAMEQTSTIRSKVLGFVRVGAFVLAVFSIIATFALMSGSIDVQLTQARLYRLVVGTSVVALVLFAVVLIDLFRLYRERKRGQAGARLHTRIVGLFTLLAAVPTILIAIIASITLERGLNPWFSGALKELVTNSGTIAQGYQQQLCQNVGREMRLMAEDIDRAKRVGVYDQNRTVFKNFLTTRAITLGFPFAVIMTAEGTIIERADTRSPEEPLPPREQDFKDAATPEPPCLISARHVGALMTLPAFDGNFLFVARLVDQRAVTFGRVAEQAEEQYTLLDTQRGNVQRAFAIMFAIITLMLLLSAIWIGLAFADRLVEPIRRLITATDAVAAGNLYVQVPTQKSEGDIGRLGSTFNNMIAEIRGQQNRLMTASEALDRRRQFTEAVLSGVSVGVLGLGDDGTIAISNPVAEKILGQLLTGYQLADIAPEIDALFQEARAGRARTIQRQIAVSRNGRDTTLFVRVTSEQSAVDVRGFVVTLDDISELVTAQRTSAWADVARRIAHEIKNPLTPIQLSAERIRRKYGRHITEDREIFDQCTDTIIRQVDDIRRMVDEFSSFARMPKPTVEREDIVDVLRQGLFMMRVAHPTIHFTDNLPQTPLTIKFDRRLVGQAVQNILKNATEGIAAKAGVSQDGQVQLAIATGQDAKITIDISDNGVGFPAENRQRLLEPYMTTREGGTGLGLAIVAKIFEDHGGGIQLLDNPDGRGGALVRMTIDPHFDAGADTPMAATIAPAGGMASARVGKTEERKVTT